MVSTVGRSYNKMSHGFFVRGAVAPGIHASRDISTSMYVRMTRN